ncbi:endolytic transglycosylase MltG [Hugenholtzia roseola]|uniref:endolytic transglycosylase MltG n=1 Tax=Hugenholtzia roseola TaxID=1002 RepID=UPI00040B07FB|nr:endolytic transglycosylase MltG [Hugenholtzia roseola]
MQKKHKILMMLFIGITTFIVSSSYYAYQMAYTPNIVINQGEAVSVYIPKGATYLQTLDTLRKYNVFNDEMSFRAVARFLKYPDLVRAGHYTFTKEMSNLAAIRMLRGGQQAAVLVTFNNNLRTLPELAGKLSRNLALDSATLSQYLQDPKTAEKYGFKPETFIAMFLPNTYQMYWTTTEEQLLERLKQEYDKFWSEKRLKKAQAIGLTPLQVSILAAIVDAEQTQRDDEKPRIAGVYLNRLEKDMPLQADPTLVFAIGDFSIKRVLNQHKEIDSPFNTYKYTGLPPAPIRLPSIAGLEAVLNPEKHDYIFFCAREDFSGYHNFAVTYSEHERNARSYQAALDKAGIR